MAAIGAASAAVQFAGQAQATNAYNAQAAAAHRDARIAAVNKYGDIQRRYNYDAKANNQEGYKAAMKGRSEMATGIASAGSAGIAGGSITLDNLISMSRQTAAENEARVQTKRDDMRETFLGQGQSIQAEAQGRINSMPFKPGPNPLGLAINLASAGVGGAQSAGYISPTFGGAQTSPLAFGTPSVYGTLY
jgi:hypothetical protein